MSESPNNPMALAASAKTKLQAFMKNVEEVISTNKSNEGTTSGESDPIKEGAASIESALRAVFSSCTFGADGVVATGEEHEEHTGATASTSSHSKSARGDARDSTGAPKRKTQSTSKPVERTQPPQPRQNDIGEHIYAQLFFDDQIRAAKAVSSLRNNDETPRPQPSHLAGSSSNNIPRPFPASSPAHASATAQTMTPLDISANLTFDDSISAISAHTLEALAQTNGIGQTRSDLTKESTDSSLFPREGNTVSKPPPSASASKQPYIVEDMPRSRSSQTNNSSPSKHSHSTRTTESSSFANWQREEKKYWVSVAEKEVAIHKNRSRRSSSGSRSSVSWNNGPTKKDFMESLF